MPFVVAFTAHLYRTLTKGFEFYKINKLGYLALTQGKVLQEILLQRFVRSDTSCTIAEKSLMAECLFE